MEGEPLLSKNSKFSLKMRHRTKNMGTFFDTSPK